MSQSGYCDCACRDCFEIAISDAGEPALCGLCEEAGCDCDGSSECQADPALEDGDDTDPDDDGSVHDDEPDLYLGAWSGSDREDFHSDG